jgi:hypothetical protein
MATVNENAAIVERVLRNVAQRYPAQKNRTVYSFDRDNEQFVLLREGWDGYQRNHFAWIHIETRDGKFWIHRDGTEHGIANDLLAAGIPKERIVLAFQHPIRRERGEFAVA